MNPAEKRNPMRGKYFAAALDVVSHVSKGMDGERWAVGMARILKTDLAGDRWLTVLMADNPELDATGYGTDCGKDPAALRTLAGDVDGVLRSVGWLAVQGWAQGGADHYASTYTLKHRAERATGAYISNGAMCAAALLLRPAGLRVDLDGARRNPVVGVLLDR